jgi:NAD+ kinase
VVLADDEEVRIGVAEAPCQARLTVDGHIGFDLSSGDRVHVARAPHRTRVVRCGRRSFYTLLREKFAWGGGRAQAPAPHAAERGEGELAG